MRSKPLIILPVLAASVAVYFFGFLYWGLNPLPYKAWTQTADDEAAQRALLEHFPANGTYFIPGRDHPPEEMSRLYEKGPVAFVHMLDRDGRPVMDPSIMARGFIHTFMCMLFLAGLLYYLLPGLPTFLSRFGFCVYAGAIAAYQIDIGESIWWTMPGVWKLHQAFYSFAVWVIGGAVLSAFIRPVPGKVGDGT